MNRSLLACATALAAVAAPDVAAAADIATVLGAPDDPNGVCGGGPTPSNDGLLVCPGWAESLCLHRVDLETVTPQMPNAVCNDGTPASFYIREGSGDDVNRWVIHLQGGAACMDEASCEERWCGDGFYDASMMSSDANADGIYDRDEHMFVYGISYAFFNDFSTWNHVYVPYCSSDAWQGRESDVDFGGTSAFTVDFRGHTILSAVRRALRKDNVDPNWTAVDPDYSVPDLDDATEILFTGSSAGGYGALQNGDWFLEPFTTARTGLVVDAAIDIDPGAAVNYDVWEADTNTNFASHVLTSHADRWAPGGYWSEIDAFVDETCEANYPLDRCSSPYLELVLSSGGVPMIETPTFLRFDLEDAVLSEYLTASPNMYDDVFEVGRFSNVTPVLDDYMILMRETMQGLYEEGETDISVFAPRCGEHVGLESLNAFTGVTVPETDAAGNDLGGDITFHDALLEWFDPDGAFTRSGWIDTDDVAGGYSGC
jgi:hypothetical protein